MYTKYIIRGCIYLYRVRTLPLHTFPSVFISNIPGKNILNTVGMVIRTTFKYCVSTAACDIRYVHGHIQLYAPDVYFPEN